MHVLEKHKGKTSWHRSPFTFFVPTPTQTSSLCRIDVHNHGRVHTAKHTHTHTKIPSVSRKLLTKRNVFPHHARVGLHNRHHWEQQTRSWLMGLKRSTEQSNDVSGHQTHIDRWSCRHITRTHARTHSCTPCTHLSESVHSRKKKTWLCKSPGRSSGISYRVCAISSGTAEHVARCHGVQKKGGAEGKIDDR